MRKKVTREAARAAGLTRYYTGRPCAAGHVTERLVSNGACLQCLRDAKNASKTAARRASGRDSWRRHTARRLGYLPPPRERDCPPRPSNGRCQTCHKPTQRLDLHHNHKTGEFIAWTCRRCISKFGKHHMDDLGRRRPHAPRRRRRRA
jgi:hypothetical protein